MTDWTREDELEYQLQQAINTVEFLHGCLTDKVYSYAYPEMTLRHLEEWKKLVPEPTYCIHSRKMEGCEFCEYSWERRMRRATSEYVPK